MEWTTQMPTALGLTEARAPMRAAPHVHSNEFCWVCHQAWMVVCLDLHAREGEFPSLPLGELAAPGPLPPLLLRQTPSLPGSVWRT